MKLVVIGGTGLIGSKLVNKLRDHGHEAREVVADPHARYYGIELSEKTLVPGDGARLGQTRFETWLSQPAAQIPSVPPQPTGDAVLTKEKETRKKAS